MMVVWTVVSECTGAGGFWRELSSVKRHKEETEGSGLGQEREGCKSRQRRLLSGGLHSGGLLPHIP